MANDEDPWRRDKGPERHYARIFLWVALLGLGAFGLLYLSDAFPGQLSSGEDRFQLIYLLVLLALISSGVIVSREFKLKETVRNILLWTGILLVLALGFTFQNEITNVALRVRAALIPGYPVATAPDVLVLSESPDGHFHVFGDVNGARISFLIDTGASEIVLSPADALKAGIDIEALEFTRVYQTANGLGRGANATLDTLTIGPIALSDVRVSVNEAPMQQSLLGMTFLKRMASFQIEGNQLYLRWR